MGKKLEGQKQDKIEAVLQILRTRLSLTLKQEKFCSKVCVGKFLSSKGENVKKAARCLHACLNWRDAIGADNLMADEFSSELSEGTAYVAGFDEDCRPVIILRITQDYQKLRSHKRVTRLIVFTIEVALAAMLRADQFVLLFDASVFRSASAFMNLLLGTLKIVADYYPGRLHKAFVFDPPSLFSYIWKGVRPFVELSTATTTVSTVEYGEPLDFGSDVGPKVGGCSSSRFSFTVAHHFDSLKPWYLTLTDASSSRVRPHQCAGPALVSQVNARSQSFASRTPVGGRGFFPSTPLPQRVTSREGIKLTQPRTPGPSFPSVFCKKGGRLHDAFVPYLVLYRIPYDETIYRAKMRPPLGGIVSIVTPQMRRRHVSISQRF